MTGGHGGDIYGNKGIRLDFSVNVNPLGMPDHVRRAAEESISRCGSYPDCGCRELSLAASSRYQISEDSLIFGNGAAELIFLIVQALRPRRAVLTAPSFSEYESALAAFGAEIRLFPLREEQGFRLPVREYLDFLKAEEPQLIFLCNPANPTGVLTGREDMEKILDFCRENGIFAVVDECFLEFLKEPERLSCLDLVRSGRRGLFVLKALTKTFAMPGLRLGYGFLAEKELRERMEAGRQSWSVSIPAQAAGTAAFTGPWEEFLEETRRVLSRERSFLAEGLKRLGFLVFDSAADYLFFKDRIEEKPGRLYECLLKEGILIRNCGNYRGLTGRHYRISVKCHGENREFLEIIGRLL